MRHRGRSPRHRRRRTGCRHDPFADCRSRSRMTHFPHMSDPISPIRQTPFSPHSRPHFPYISPTRLFALQTRGGRRSQRGAALSVGWGRRQRRSCRRFRDISSCSEEGETGGRAVEGSRHAGVQNMFAVSCWVLGLYHLLSCDGSYVVCASDTAHTIALYCLLFTIDMDCKTKTTTTDDLLNTSIRAEAAANHELKILYLILIELMISS